MPYRPLHLTPRMLLGPGPSDLDPAVLAAMAHPLVGHLDPQFIALMDETKAMLREIFRTRNEVTFTVSGPGSAGMEMCLVNLLEPGDEALVCVAGVFGTRMSDIVERCGARLQRVDAPWGKPIDPADVAAMLQQCHPKVVAIVHAETSTGVHQPLEEILRLARAAGALTVVDAVTSLGGVEVDVDGWPIDAIYSGSQKCLSAPPGLSPVSFGPRALEAIDKRKTKVQSWFLDVTLIRNYWSGARRAYHHTAPVSANFAMREALRLVLEEGLENRIARHRRVHERLRDGLLAMGFRFLVDERYRLPQLNTVFLPAGMDDASTRARLLEEFNIEVGAGLGEFAGKLWRIGLMGSSATERHVDALLSALRQLSKG